MRALYQNEDRITTGVGSPESTNQFVVLSASNSRFPQLLTEKENQVQNFPNFSFIPKKGFNAYLQQPQVKLNVFPLDKRSPPPTDNSKWLCERCCVPVSSAFLLDYLCSFTHPRKPPRQRGAWRAGILSQWAHTCSMQSQEQPEKGREKA